MRRYRKPVNLAVNALAVNVLAFKMYLRVFLTLFSGFVHFEVEFIVFWSLKPALRAFLGPIPATRLSRSLLGSFRGGGVARCPTASNAPENFDLFAPWA